MIITSTFPQVSATQTLADRTTREVTQTKLLQTSTATGGDLVLLDNLHSTTNLHGLVSNAHSSILNLPVFPKTSILPTGNQHGNLGPIEGNYLLPKSLLCEDPLIWLPRGACCQFSLAHASQEPFPEAQPLPFDTKSLSSRKLLFPAFIH